MRLLLDQGLPRSTVRHLDAAGVESAHVGEKGLATASDA
jgi:predicted nuclease of predicted toxin-antitoxin system